MPARRSGRSAKHAAAHGRSHASVKHSVPAAVPQTSEAVRNYIAEMAAELAELALASRLDSLAVACDVVREIAEGNVQAQSRLLQAG